MALFGTNKQLNTHQRHPDAYYKTVWVSKKMDDGIVWVAKMERLSKIRAVHLLLERGFSSYMGEKIKTELALRELESKPHLTRFVLEFRKFAREHGMDISKFI
jgi:hypothetical protein